jgi:DNA-binding transcriptional LysR family regulator
MRFESLEDLRVLVETARSGTLTAAARTLGVTPAAASAMLKRLEARLGERLFERSTRAMRLTPQGQTLLDYATRALELLQEGEAQLATASRTLVGTVRIAAPSDLARSVLLPWLDDFMAGHPGVRVALAVTDRVQDLMRDAVDVALRYGQPADSRLVARTLCTTRRVLCAAPAYLQGREPPRTPQDLAAHNCLTFHIDHRRHTLWRFERDGAWAQVRVDGDRDCDDAAIAHQWALAGAGLVYKSELDVADDMRAGRLLRVLPDWHGEPYPLHAVLPSNRFVPARVRALVDFIAARFERFAALPTPR